MSDLRRGATLPATALLVILGLWIGYVELGGLDGAVASQIPAGFDTVAAAIRRVTPPGARIEVAGTPSVTVFERAVYDLYPRTVYTAVDTSYMHAHPPLHLSWARLFQAAHRDGAGYVFLWLPGGLPGGLPPGVLVQAQSGTLVAVR